MLNYVKISAESTNIVDMSKINSPRNSGIPAWVPESIFYHIFPDRFARGRQVSASSHLRLQPWGSSPQAGGFQGGDLWGIADRLGFLEDLGVNALYLNPIFASPANHRYHTTDYFAVDPLLGGNEAFAHLIAQCRRRGIRVVLDGVFNHCGRGFWPFHHLLENGADSPYRDWFHVSKWPLNPYPLHRDSPHHYRSWWNLPALPQLNIANPDVRAYLMRVVRHWIEAGIDGWRLDAIDQIPDLDFWAELRETASRANPEAYIFGEIWHHAPDYLSLGGMHGLTNYPLREAVLRFFGFGCPAMEHSPAKVSGRGRAARLAKCLEWQAANYPLPHTRAMFNMLESHDTARALWSLDGDAAALKLSLLLLMCLPGVPGIYAGSEIGIRERSSRSAYPWETPESRDEDMLDFHRRICRLRRENPVLQLGECAVLYARGDLFALERNLGEQRLVAVFNRGKESRSLGLPRMGINSAAPDALQFLWGKEGWLKNRGTLALPGQSAVIISAPPGDC